MDNIIYNLLLIFVTSTVILFVLLIIAYRKTLNSIENFKGILAGLADGNIIKIKSNEFSSKLLKKIILPIENIQKSMERKIAMAKQIVDGEDTISLDGMHENDILANLLVELHQNLKFAKVEEQKRRNDEEKQNWATKGEAMFGEILRTSGVDVDELSFSLMKNLVDYTGAIQGGLFVKNDEDDSVISYELKAAIAYGRRKLMDKKFNLGESLVGRCAFEKLTVYLEDVPNNYVFVTSGLGESNPRSILLIPAKMDDVVYAVIELVSFKKFEPYQIHFIEKIGESIASSIGNVKINEKTQKLLMQSKSQSEEMAAQEEELRQNLEELQATQEEVTRMRGEEKVKNEKTMLEIEMHRKTLIKIIDQIPSKIFLKDDDCRMLIVNDAVLKAHHATNEDLLGKNDFDFIDNKAEAQQYYDDEQDIIKSGKPKRVLQKENINNTGVYLDSIKIPFYIDYLDKTGILGIQNDITHVVNLEDRVKELEELNSTLQEQDK